MDKRGLFFAYFNMSKAQLLGLINLDFEKLFKVKRKFRKEWIKNDKCGCTNNPRILNNQIRLNCNHIKKEMKEKTREIEKKITEKSSILLYKNLRKVKGIQQISYGL